MQNRCFDVVLLLYCFLFSILESSNHFKTVDTRLRYHTLRKTFGKSFRSYYEILSIVLCIIVSRIGTKRNLVYKLRRVKGAAHYISSGSKIVQRLWRRQYNPAIIKRTVGLVLSPYIALYRFFPKHCKRVNNFFILITCGRRFLNKCNKFQMVEVRYIHLLNLLMFTWRHFR